MRLKIWLHILAFVFLGSQVVQAQTLNDYYDTSKEIPANKVICGVVGRANPEARCFVTLDYTRALTVDSDPSGMLKRGATTPRQNEFSKVVVRELMVEVDASLKARGQDPQSSARMVMARVSWEGQVAGQKLSYRDVVIGEIALNSIGGLSFKLEEIITQMSAMGHLFPQKETAQIFGGDSNSQETRDALLKWTQSLLDAVLPEYFKDKKYSPNRKKIP